MTRNSAWSWNPRILVAEDNKLIRDVYHRALSEYTLLGAPDGVHGKNYFASAVRLNKPFDLVITDNSMPRCSGAELVSYIRELELSTGLSRTPIIMITGDGFGLEDIDLDELLSKPVKLDTLRERVDYCLGYSPRLNDSHYVSDDLMFSLLGGRLPDED